MALSSIAVKPAMGEPEDFSLVLGGPLYQLLLRTGMVRPPFGNLGSRIAVLTALAWLPLVPLTLVSGRFSAGVQIPFLYDFEVQSRLLFSLPLMILAEVIVYVRMRAIAAQFMERQIVTANIRPAFDAVLRSAMRLRNSVAVEIALLVLVFLAGPILWRQTAAIHANTWYATIDGSGLTTTWAGGWYKFISVPLFQFILLRWYYRIFIWFRFLFQISRLDLNLVTLHPDRCCGLGFLGNVAVAFAPLLMAHSGLVAGFIANRVVHGGATLPEYKMEILAMALFLLALVLGPLCVFVPKLNRARLAGLRTYGRLASDYVVDFAAKWSRGAAGGGEPILGSADIQSMADLSNSFAIVQEMKLVPFGKQTIVRFVIIIALPLLPLTLTMFSFEELLKRLIQVVL